MQIKIENCPLCHEPLLEVFKFKTSVWCDNCTAEISIEEGKEYADNTGTKTGWQSHN